jgi:hexokinase
MSESDSQHDDPVEVEPVDADITVPVRSPPRDVILAIDIGGTKFAAGLVTAKGN